MIKLIFDTIKKDEVIDRERLAIIFDRVIKKQFANSEDLRNTFECIFCECFDNKKMIELLGFNTEPIQVFTKKSKKEFLGSNSMRICDYAAMLIKLEKLGLDFGGILHSIVFEVRHNFLGRKKYITHNEASVLWYEGEKHLMSTPVSVCGSVRGSIVDDVTVTNLGYIVGISNKNTGIAGISTISPSLALKK